MANFDGLGNFSLFPLDLNREDENDVEGEVISYTLTPLWGFRSNPDQNSVENEAVITVMSDSTTNNQPLDNEQLNLAS